MKANELMIDDWVTVIQDEGADIDKQWSVNDYIDTNAEYCEPIHLTEEILKANGWVERPYSSICEKEGVPFALGIGKVELYIGECIGDDTVIFSFEYVHQVQHALRLFGLTDLADNFNV